MCLCDVKATLIPLIIYTQLSSITQHLAVCFFNPFSTDFMCWCSSLLVSKLSLIFKITNQVSSTHHVHRVFF